MQKYVRLTKHLTREFDRVEFAQNPRSQNTMADEVSKLALSEEEGISMNLEMEVQKYPSIEEIPTFAIQRANSWMTPIVAFLQDGHLPQNTEEAKKVKKKAARFTILNDTLYKRGFSMPYLKCVDEEESQYILAEIHQGIYGNHAGLKSLVNKAIITGYFQPTMQVDAMELVKKCDRCQRYGNVQWLPAERLTAISSPRPFVQWGIDIVGPLPQGKGQVKFLLVTINYFTKWVKTEVLATITEARIQSFVWKNIIYRFGIPLTIISDNGRQFDSQGFRDFCSGLGIKNQFSSPGHPQANGQTEVTNRTLLKIIKTKLDDAKGAWPEELPNVLWAYKTTVRRGPNGGNPLQTNLWNQSGDPRQSRSNQYQMSIVQQRRK